MEDDDVHDIDQQLILGMAGMSDVISRFAQFFHQQVTSDNITEQEYVTVIGKLRQDGANPNLCLDIPIMSMSGLEYSTYRLDWKMFVVFFMNGADPQENAFDGVIQTMASFHGVGEPMTFSAFQNLNGNYDVIPGYRGLYCIMNDVLEEPDEGEERNQFHSMRAVLGLTEVLYKGVINCDHETITKVRESIQLLESDFAWNETFTFKAKALLLVVNRIVAENDLPSDATSIISKFLIPDLLLSTIREFLEGVIGRLEAAGNSDESALV